MLFKHPPNTDISVCICLVIHLPSARNRSREVRQQETEGDEQDEDGCENIDDRGQFMFC